MGDTLSLVSGQLVWVGVGGSDMVRLRNCGLKGSGMGICPLTGCCHDKLLHNSTVSGSSLRTSGLARVPSCVGVSQALEHCGFHPV
jgi:hypothetical protein